MNISEIRERKRELENKIESLMNHFISETEVNVTDIEFLTDSRFGSSVLKSIVYVKIKAEIP